MSRIEKIEDQVRELPAEELAQFRAWFARYDGELWDRQLEDDANSGSLDRLAERALRDHEADAERNRSRSTSRGSNNISPLHRNAPES